MRNFSQPCPTPSPVPPAVHFISRKARISQEHARVVAELFGLPVDPWPPIKTAMPAASKGKARA